VPVALKFIRLGEDTGRLEQRALEFLKGPFCSDCPLNPAAEEILDTRFFVT
jgi:hypothetical protein